MSNQFVCWKCGSGIDARALPYRRLEQCAACGTELHACRMCRHFSPRLAGRCSEDRAEEVMDKERANFCDYFTLRPEAYVPPDKASKQRAKADLDALFTNRLAPDSSGGDDQDDTPRTQLDDLFER